MKVKVTGMVLVVAVLLGMMAMPAAANSVAPTAGVFAGEASVGKKGVCNQDGSGSVSGAGLGLANAEEPTQVLDVKRAWYTIDAPASVVDVVYGQGSLKLCGKLGPNLTGLGASCATTKGWDGQGKASFTNLLTGAGKAISISNLGWIATAGGTFLVTGDVGDYTAGTKKKADQLVAVVQALDDEVVLNCLEKRGSGRDQTGGATTFDVVAVYSIVPDHTLIDDKKEGNEDPKAAK